MSNSKVPQSKRNNRKKNPQQNGTKKTTDKDSSTAASISSEILQNLSFKERDQLEQITQKLSNLHLPDEPPSAKELYEQYCKSLVTPKSENRSTDSQTKS